MALNVVSNKSTQPKGPLLTLTSKAIHMVKEGMAAEKLENHGLRVGVVGGGCSGFSYSLDFDKEAKEGDITWEVDGLKIFVDPVSHLPSNQGDWQQGAVR